MNDEQKRQFFRLLSFTGIVICAVLVTFAATLYETMKAVDNNLAYMALYYDDLSVDYYAAGADIEAVLVLQNQAVKYCDMYLAEKRVLSSWEYAYVCGVVYERSKLFILCMEDVDMCPDEALDNLDQMILDAEPLGKKLHEMRPYMSNVFSDDPTIKDICVLGGDPVPCPSTL